MKPEFTSLYAPHAAVRPEHFAALESELLGRFDARPAPTRPWLRSRPVPRPRAQKSTRSLSRLRPLHQDRDSRQPFQSGALTS